MNTNIGLSIFNQICEVNELDPQKIKDLARQQPTGKSVEAIDAEHLIRTAFNYKAKTVVKQLNLGTTTERENIREGEEYSISADPAAPSFTINEDFIHGKYSEDEAKSLIDALGKVMLPVTG